MNNSVDGLQGQLSPEELYDRWLELRNAPTLPVPDWAGARCAEMIALGQVAPNTWYPEKTDKETRELAVSICNGCPIVDRCRDYGMAYEKEGIWGGVDRNPPKEISDSWAAEKLNREGKCRNGHPLDVTCSDGHGGVKRQCSTCLAVNMERLHRRNELAVLPALERVRGLIAMGLTNIQMGAEMGVHRRTVERYRKQLKNLDSTERKAVA